MCKMRSKSLKHFLIMKNTTSKVSFVIVNYNSTKELLRCLSDLDNLKDSSIFDVIIVNNDTKQLSLKNYSFNKQLVCEINQNIGYGKASNIGLFKAKAPFVCFLNPDTHSFSSNFTKIISSITHDKMIVAPRIYTESGDIEPWSVGQDITLTQIIKNNLHINSKPWLSRKDMFVDWASGAALFAHTKFIKSLGGFDEDFFLYFEDVDLCKRIKKQGGNIKYTPSFSLIHTSGASSKKNTRNQKRCYYKSQNLFFKKHLSAPEYFLMRALRFLTVK